uniref:Uncharacterized protein n=1 Tax=Odontella aurita TaxID=265563 RepID=A0A7S4NF68_9STRA
MTGTSVALEATSAAMSPGCAGAASLAVHLGVDALSACLTALCVAPLITVFDEAIARSASGREGLWTAFGRRMRSALSDPLSFFMSDAFRWMWIVYASTYFIANGLGGIERVSGMKFGFLSTLAVTVVNMVCGIAKDSAYSKMFGGSDTPEDEGGDESNTETSTPMLAYATWFARDVTAFSFILTLPPMAASAFPRFINLDLARFASPILAQYVTTMLHLIGFNMCRHSASDDSVSTTAASRRETWLRMPAYWSTVAARQMRVIPPYSIGGVLNGKLVSSAPVLAEMITGISLY